MAGARVELDARGAERGLGALVGALEDPRPLLANIREYLLRVHRERFDKMEAPDGTPWAALTPAYQRRKHRNAGRILVLRGYLRNTLVGQIDTEGLVFGTNLIYGAAHQFGREEIGLPARPWLGLSEDDENYLVTLAHRYLERAAATR